MIPEWMIYRMEEIREKCFISESNFKYDDLKKSVSERYYRAWGIKSYWGKLKKINGQIT